MRIAKAIAALIALFIFLTACGRNQERTIYADERITINRVGRSITVTENEGGRSYTYAVRRVKRNREDAEAHRAQTLTETPDIYVQTAKGIIVITVKKDLKTIIIPAKSH